MISRANKLVPEADRAKRWTALPKITDLQDLKDSLMTGVAGKIY